MDRKTARKRAQELVGRMTLEEKASQLRYDAPAIERLGIPAYNWWNEALHGVARAGTATMFPQAIGLAAAFDEGLMEEVGRCIAQEGRAKYNEQSARGDRDIYKGLTFWSPNVNIFRDPRWGRGHETYGEDPTLTSRLAVGFIKGVQGEGEYLQAAACAKHLAAHSGPEAQRHGFDAQVSPKDLEETYLPAFEACVKEGRVEAVMGAYNRVNGEPCCASPFLQEKLRVEWGFEGHFVSDCGAIKDFHENHGVTGRPEESVKLALENGCDVNCGCTYQKILNAVEEGILEERYVTESCVRLFTTRFLLGMFDKTEYDGLGQLDVETGEHLALSQRAAQESMVLLKNSGLLPLDLDRLGVIGVIGPNADSRAALVGNYHGTASRYITVLEGIQDAAGEAGVRVLYSQGCHLFAQAAESLSAGEYIDRLAEARAVADHSDVVVLVVGLDETLEGEEGDAGNAYASGDKRDLHLPAAQEKLMETVLGCGKPVVVVNMTGSAVDLRYAQEKAGAVLQAWYPGPRGGRALADILFGRVSPSGKLPVTFYRGLDDLPEFTDYGMEGRTYRFYKGEPLYPFGYGLTYGGCRAVEAACAGAGPDALRLRVTVRNDGRETEDVLQVYVKDEDSSCAPVNPVLAGFRRVRLGRGEARVVEVPLPGRCFTTVDEAGVRALRGKRFTFYAGFSQPDGRSAQLCGTAPVEVEVQLP